MPQLKSQKIADISPLHRSGELNGESQATDRKSPGQAVPIWRHCRNRLRGRGPTIIRTSTTPWPPISPVRKRAAWNWSRVTSPIISVS